MFSSFIASSLPVTASGAAAQSSKSGSSSSEIPSELPFQLQIIYTDTDGTKALRVLTQKKPVTRDRKVAEERKYKCSHFLVQAYEERVFGTTVAQFYQ